MKLLTYKTNDTEPRLGFIHNNQVIDMEDFGEISNFPLPDNMLDLIDLGFELVEELNDMIAETDAELFDEIAYEMDEVTFLAPIPKPRKNIIGIGLNYTEHVAESARTLRHNRKITSKTNHILKTDNNGNSYKHGYHKKHQTNRTIRLGS